MKRTVFWKRMTALALAAILLLGLLPAAAFGAEPSDEPVQTKYVSVSYTHLTLPTKRIV